MQLTTIPQAALAKIGVILLTVGLVFGSGYYLGRKSIIKSDAVAAVKDTVQNVKEVTEANVVYKDRVETVIKYIHDKPAQPVSLCVPSSSEQAPAPGSSESSPPGLADSVHDGDNGVRPQEAGPDISVLLSAYAAVFAVNNDALAAEQSVK